MILSERGAIKSAIADGGFNLYPAGRLIEMIKAGLQGDELRGNFLPQAAVEKLSHCAGPESTAAKKLFDKDMKLLCKRLSEMDPEYDIESVFDKMASAAPAMTKRYYGVENIELPRPKVVEYYFEGHNDMYKDGDWVAFNVNKSESVELGGVPVGTYFKRDQVSPGQPEYVALHEANHAMQEAASNPEGGHHYIPWYEEGFADIFAKMMLLRAAGDEKMLAKIKNFRMEVDANDPRKVCYHYGEETAALILLRARLPFAKALMKVRRHDAFFVDWDKFANAVKMGSDPHIALFSAYTGGKPDHFKKRVERDENLFRKDADLDQQDLKVITMFLATQTPALAAADEYLAALWLVREATENRNSHHVDPASIPSELRPKMASWSETALIPASEIPAEIWKKAPMTAVKVLLKEQAIPDDMKKAVDALAARYWIIKRKIGDCLVYEPYGGGLPYRLGTGEIRCTY